jgi:hypothetical protein
MTPKDYPQSNLEHLIEEWCELPITVRILVYFFVGFLVGLVVV